MLFFPSGHKGETRKPRNVSMFPYDALVGIRCRNGWKNRGAMPVKVKRCACRLNYFSVICLVLSSARHRKSEWDRNEVKQSQKYSVEYQDFSLWSVDMSGLEPV